MRGRNRRIGNSAKYGQIKLSDKQFPKLNVEYFKENL